jgi:hypothetical protein
MFNQSIWKCDKDNDSFSLNGTKNFDEYILEYAVDNETITEPISIFISNQKHALLVSSNRFGRTDIFIFDDNTIEINKKTYKRILNQY